MKVIWSKTYRLGGQTILNLVTDGGHEIKAHESNTAAGKWWCYWMNDKGWLHVNDMLVAGIVYEKSAGPGTYGDTVIYLTPETLTKWLHPLSLDEWSIERGNLYFDKPGEPCGYWVRY